MYGKKSPRFNPAGQTRIYSPLDEHDYAIPSTPGPIFWEEGYLCYAIINKSKGLAITSIDNRGLKLSGFNSGRDQTFFWVSVVVSSITKEG